MTNIAILGFGVVGSGVADLITKNYKEVTSLGKDDIIAIVVAANALFLNMLCLGIDCRKGHKNRYCKGKKSFHTFLIYVLMTQM